MRQRYLPRKEAKMEPFKDFLNGMEDGGSEGLGSLLDQMMMQKMGITDEDIEEAQNFSPAKIRNDSYNIAARTFTLLEYASVLNQGKMSQIEECIMNGIRALLILALCEAKLKIMENQANEDGQKED